MPPFQNWQDGGYNNAAYVDFVTVEYGGSSGSPSLGESLDNSSITWSTSGYTPWTGQTLVSSPLGGGDAARSGTVSPGGVSILEAGVTGPGAVEFLLEALSDQRLA